MQDKIAEQSDCSFFFLKQFEKVFLWESRIFSCIIFANTGFGHRRFCFRLTLCCSLLTFFALTALFVCFNISIEFNNGQNLCGEVV